jgi:hypothetical protein
MKSFDEEDMEFPNRAMLMFRGQQQKFTSNRKTFYLPAGMWNASWWRKL